ncbi:MAG: SLC13 family permease [Flammeovirgaceae bacterium]
MNYPKLIISFVLPLLILLLPKEWIPLEGLTVVEHRVIAIFIFAALSWILEPIPIYATSILIITLELLLISDKGFIYFIDEAKETDFGQLFPFQGIMATMASPIILLFLGGFFLALSASKHGLDKRLANLLLKPFGNTPQNLMLGMMIITAGFSMFMSNTATTALMLSLLAPVFQNIDSKDKLKIAFTLSIPIAANLGGIATPIGTPPNAIAMKYLVGENAISFLEWMIFGVPLVIFMVLFSWWLLKTLYRSNQTYITVNLDKGEKTTIHTYIVYGTFWLTLFLWITDFWHGMNSYTVAMIPVAVFLATGIITKEDLQHISWEVLWLVAGGIAIGDALEISGLAARIIENIPFTSMPTLLIVFIFGAITLFMANFMSNTATTNLIMPLAVAVGSSLTDLAELGGLRVMILAVVLNVSLGMCLPISTPPNALAHATGWIETKDMTKTGLIIGFVGITTVFVLLFILNKTGFF